MPQPRNENYFQMLRDAIGAKGGPLTSAEKISIQSECTRATFIRYLYKFCGNVAAACAATGVTRGTYLSWRREFPDFAEKINSIDEALIDFAEAQLQKNIRDGKETSLIFYLCNKGRSRGWQDVRKIEHKQDKRIEITVKTAIEAGMKPVQSRVIEAAKPQLVEEVAKPEITDEVVDEITQESEN